MTVELAYTPKKKTVQNTYKKSETYNINVTILTLLGLTTPSGHVARFAQMYDQGRAFKLLDGNAANNVRIHHLVLGHLGKVLNNYVCVAH